MTQRPKKHQLAHKDHTRIGLRLRAITLGMLWLLVFFAPHAAFGQARTVTVGVYQNQPKVFTDENGQARGIFVELLNAIATQAGWTVVYVPCEWAACLQALEAGELDLMPDVAYSAERAALYDFHQTPVLESWSTIYAAPGTAINQIAELEGRRVAVLEGSIQQTTFEHMVQGFGYQTTLVPVGSLEEAFDLAAHGAADAAIANHFFGDYFYQDYGLVKTAIVFNPATLYYATAKGRNGELLATIDRMLDQWMQEPDSPYYHTLSHWVDKPPAASAVPSYVFWVAGGILGLLAGAIGLIFLLRQQVAARTRYLEQASRDLQKSEERYRTLARISPIGIFRTAPDGTTTYVNPKWCEISGLTAEAALGDGWLAAVHPDDRAKLQERWQTATQQQQPSFSEYRFVRPDGTLAWVMGQAVPERNAEQQIVGYVGTLTDITERKQVETALRASERQLSLIYANISDILFYLAVEGEADFRFVSVNAAFLQATGLTAEQVIDQPFQAVIPAPAQALVLGKYQEALRTKQAVGWQEVSVYPAGTKYAEASVTPILDAQGHCTHLLGTVHDVTARVQAENELQRLNAELEERVAQRTEELNAAMHKALEADRLKSAFLATMSHELRTPLNSIIGFSGVLLQGLAGPLNPEQTKQLGMTRDSARHLLALINDVLDISKIEAGQLEIAHAPFAMRAAIENALRSVSPQAQKKGLTLTVAIASTVGQVVSDRRRVEQILLNFLSNAIKFTERGEVRLTCRAHGAWLEISVRDTGIGIRPTDLEKLFQPFHQLETGLNRRHEGTGLGLAICKNLASLLGGHIHATSEWGIGSTFTLTLPLTAEGAAHGEHSHH